MARLAGQKSIQLLPAVLRHNSVLSGISGVYGAQGIIIAMILHELLALVVGLLAASLAPFRSPDVYPVGYRDLSAPGEGSDLPVHTIR